MQTELQEKVISDNKIYTKSGLLSKEILDFTMSGHAGSEIFDFDEGRFVLKHNLLIPEMIRQLSPRATVVIVPKLSDPSKVNIDNFGEAFNKILKQRIYGGKNSYAFAHTIAKGHDLYHDYCSARATHDYYDPGYTSDVALNVCNRFVEGTLFAVTYDLKKDDGGNPYIIITMDIPTAMMTNLLTFERTARDCKAFLSRVKEEYSFASGSSADAQKIRNLLNCVNVWTYAMKIIVADAVVDALEEVTDEVVPEYFKDSWATQGVEFDHNGFLVYYKNTVAPDGKVVAFEDLATKDEFMGELKEECIFFPAAVEDVTKISNKFAKLVNISKLK